MVTLSRVVKYSYNTALLWDGGEGREEGVLESLLPTSDSTMTCIFLEVEDFSSRSVF